MRQTIRQTPSNLSSDPRPVGWYKRSAGPPRGCVVGQDMCESHVVGRRCACPTLQAWPIGIALLVAATVGCPGLARAADEEDPVEKRIAETARYLSSDELEGRGIGTKGINLAADYIAAQFAQAGLKTDRFDKTAFQKFAVATSAKLGPDNKLALVGPPAKEGQPVRRIELKPGTDFNPMSLSGSGTLGLPLVFVGYGITGKKEGYDDFAGLDVKGKAVVILRHEPQQGDPKSVFDGTRHSAHAPFSRKVSNACEHGAAAVVFCSDRFDLDKNVAVYRKAWYRALDRLAAEHAKFKEIKDPKPEQIEAQRRRIDALMRLVQSASERLQPGYDPLVPLGARAGRSAPKDCPVVYCRRAVIDQVVKAALGTDLAALEKEIDEGPTPHSKALSGWTIEGQVEVRREEVEVKNVVGVLEAEGPLADQTLVIGAHYDHLGYGGWGSLARGSKAIHNGADDNASGVAVLVELARRLATHRPKLKRRVVFVAFTAEERGLLGSSHYVQNPPFPLEKTVAMINLDMVGRLRDEKLTVMGAGTATHFDELLEQFNAAYGFRLTKNPSGFGPSDQMVFYARKIPVLHFFTGTHKDYHRPSDDFETLNVPGMRRIAGLVGEVAVALADATPPPEYVAVPARRILAAGDRPYLGTMPDFGRQIDGYAISGVVPGGPAERAGLKAGDVIVHFGDSKIGGLEDIDRGLRKHKPGERVRTTVRRGQEERTFEITLDPPR